MNDMKTIEIRIFSEKQAPSPDVDNEESKFIDINYSFKFSVVL